MLNLEYDVVAELNLALIPSAFSPSPTPDERPGLLASVAEAIVQAGLSVENVHTNLHRGKNGRVEFWCEADCVATQYMDQSDIESMVHNLSQLKQLHNLDICDVRVQRLRVQEELV
jgi:hypothetical protein